jgi:succinate dehydrogenase / fumarate reductase flavoprotein subunit
VGLAEVLRYDIIILCSELAGLRATLEASLVPDGRLRTAVVSKLHAVRSHGVAAATN